MPQHNWVYVSSLRLCLAFLLSTMASNLLGQRPGSAAADSPAALPNIVLIVSDDQGYPISAALAPSRFERPTWIAWQPRVFGPRASMALGPRALLAWKPADRTLSTA